MGAGEISRNEPHKVTDGAVSQTEVGKYLSWLPVCVSTLTRPEFDTRARPSFKTVDQLLAYIANLPHGAQWQATAMEFTGYKTTRPIRLIWRNALEVVTELLSNPMFERYMTYDPHIVMRNMEREYSEFFTGTRAFDIQVSRNVTFESSSLSLTATSRTSSLLARQLSLSFLLPTKPQSQDTLVV